MAEIKWIKIATNIFDNRKIRQIETMPEGDAIIVIWFKLLAIAGTVNDNGRIYLTETIPYTDDMLAAQFNRPLQVIRLALRTFETFGMIERDEHKILISSWAKYQNVDGMERIREQNRQRVAAHRERQRLLMDTQVCQYCGSKATGVDHIVAVARGGSDDQENLVPCCIKCNRAKNDKPLVSFLNNHLELIDVSIVIQNPLLSKLVSWDSNAGKFVTLRNVTNGGVVTVCNATEEDKEEDKEEDGNKAFAADAELETLAYGLSAVLDEAQAVGLPMSQRDMDKGNELVAEYGAEWVLEALKRTVNAPATARSWRYVGGILRNAKQEGGFGGRKVQTGTPDATPDELRGVLPK